MRSLKYSDAQGTFETNCDTKSKDAGIYNASANLIGPCAPLLDALFA